MKVSARRDKWGGKEQALDGDVGRAGTASWRYREWPLRGALGETFSCVWRSERGREAPPPVVLPDGQADLIWIDGIWRFAGPDAVAQRETVRTTDAIVGFRFQPGRASAWLGQPLAELVNQRPALAELAPTWERRLRQVVSAAGLAATVAAMCQVHESTGLMGAVADPEMIAAYELVRAGTTEARIVPQLVDRLGLSERTVRRHFGASFGYGPKTMHRVLRLQRFLTLVAARPGDPLAGLAFAAGYADQAHLSRECRALAGQTPRQLAAARRPVAGVPAGEEAGVQRVSAPVADE